MGCIILVLNMYLAQCAPDGAQHKNFRRGLVQGMRLTWARSHTQSLAPIENSSLSSFNSRNQR
ncbi:hypothetical protein M758_4G173200 [Ceratodon purpureus]|uniref:Uncharacterized protein n=1 Tax=Ceratodon purpureus TaxID=3225 RepID=A0A8T0IBP4_CERPU|nr:hypothetical protein KC19_4G171600 [Ceratodon purpureus]KAG0619894.1 hypothetical protein M758_4G173200 [Ceratodon purpureus]